MHILVLFQLLSLAVLSAMPVYVTGRTSNGTAQALIIALYVSTIPICFLSLHALFIRPSLQPFSDIRLTCKEQIRESSRLTETFRAIITTQLQTHTTRNAKCASCSMSRHLCIEETTGALQVRLMILVPSHILSPILWSPSQPIIITIDRPSRVFLLSTTLYRTSPYPSQNTIQMMKSTPLFYI